MTPMHDYLLDTCAVIWVAQGDRLREPAAHDLQEAYEHGGRLRVSPITAWEIAMLVAKGKMSLTLTPDRWFANFCELPRCHAGDDVSIRTGRIDHPAGAAASRSRRLYSHRHRAGVRVRTGDAG